jgi:hypothetical protein
MVDWDLGYHLKRTHTHIVAASSFVDMQVAWWFASASSRGRACIILEINAKRITALLYFRV